MLKAKKKKLNVLSTDTLSVRGWLKGLDFSSETVKAGGRCRPFLKC